MTFYDLPPERPAPKRGDLMESNLGDRRERTWLLLRVRRTRSKPQTPGCIRYAVWMARWWELEPEMRMRLWRSAERSGGQRVYRLYRYPAKTKTTFEQHMRRTQNRRQEA